MGIRHKAVKFPENREIKAKLKYGDGKEIARRTGLTAIYVNEMLIGRAPLSDKVKQAIIEILSERHNLDKSLEEIRSRSASDPNRLEEGEVEKWFVAMAQNLLKKASEKDG